MNHHVGRNDFDTLFQHEDIFFQGQLLKPPALIVYGKICSVQNMQELELDAFSTAPTNVPGCLHHHLRCFSRETDNHMNNNHNTGFMQPAHSILKYRQSISAPDILCGRFMHCL